MAQHRHRALLTQQLAHGAAQTANNGVLLTGDNAAGLPGGLEHQLLIQGLDGVDIDDPQADPLSGKQLCRLECLADHHARGDNGDVAARTEDASLAQRKMVIWQLIGKDIGGQALQTEIGRAVIVDQGPDRVAHLVAVTGAADQHSGDGPHQGKILNALVGGAVLTHRDAAVGTHNLYIQMGVSNGVADLLIGPAAGKHGKAVGKGLQPIGGHAGSDTGHVSFSNAAVKEPLRVGLGKEFGHGGAGQVGIQHDQLRVLGAQFSQGLAVGGAGCDFSSHISSPPIL